MKNKSDQLYIRLFHGRDRADEELSDWGFDGPTIGPVGVTWTYGGVKLHAPKWSDFEHLPAEADLVSYGGKFYGDFEVFVAGDEGLTPELLANAHDYETFAKNCKTPAPRP